MRGPGGVVSMRIRCARPRPRREAVSWAVSAVVVREERACACDWGIEIGVEEEGDEMMGVPVWSARW